MAAQKGLNKMETAARLWAEGESFGAIAQKLRLSRTCLLYTSPSPRDGLLSRMPSSA